MVNPPEAGFILRGTRPLPYPISVGSDQCSRVIFDDSRAPIIPHTHGGNTREHGLTWTYPVRGRERQYGEGMRGNRHLHHLAAVYISEHGRPLRDAKESENMGVVTHLKSSNARKRSRRGHSTRR
jgi:hypothetical protein